MSTSRSAQTVPVTYDMLRALERVGLATTPLSQGAAELPSNPRRTLRSVLVGSVLVADRGHGW